MSAQEPLPASGPSHAGAAGSVAAERHAPVDPRVVALRGQSWARRWRYALKLASWPKLLVPAVLGVLTAAAALPPGAETRRVVVAVALVGAFVVLDVVFIVLMNDWGDREVDALKRAMFPNGCSPKTIPDGVLSSRALFSAGAASGVAAVGVGFAAEWALGRPRLGLAGLAAVLVFVAYTLPPLRINYRGGGELLEALGVGLVLPMFGAYALGPTPLPRPLQALLPGFVALSLASALASGLSDEESDRAGGKRTFTTMLGNTVVRRWVTILVFVGAALFAGGWFPARASLWPGLVGAFVTLGYGLLTLRRSSLATTNAFAAQGRFKAALHHAIWRGTSSAALTAVALRFVS